MSEWDFDIIVREAEKLANDAGININPIIDPLINPIDSDCFKVMFICMDSRSWSWIVNMREVSSRRSFTSDRDYTSIW